MAHRRRKKKVVQMGDAKYGLYNFEFPKSLQPRDIQPGETTVEAEVGHVKTEVDQVEAEVKHVEAEVEQVEFEPECVELPVTIEPISTGDNMAEEHVERFMTEDGREAVKITRNQTDYHSNTKVVEVFEDKVTPHVLTKRITEYTKPVVFKIKTELVDEHGNVVEVIVEELDEASDDFKMVKHHEEVEAPEIKAPEIKAQSVVEKKEPVVKHVKKSFADMRALSVERNRNTSTSHRVHHRHTHGHRHHETCRDCGGVVQD